MSDSAVRFPSNARPERTRHAARWDLMRLSGGSLLGLAYLGFISLGLPDALLGVGWPSMRETFGVSIEAVGLILTVGVTGYLMSSVSTGFALAKLGVGWLLAGSTWLVALGLAAYAAAPLFPLALWGSLLVGLGARKSVGEGQSGD